MDTNTFCCNDYKDAGIMKHLIQTVILFLILTCSLVQGANDFSSDANCKALWNFESGALTTDSKGGNTLTASTTPTEDTTNYKQGSCSAHFDEGQNDRFYRNDADLDAGYPYKNGDTNKKISLCLWFRLDAIGEARYVYYKATTSNYSMHVFIPTWNKIQLKLSSNGTSWTNTYEHATALSANVWYHLAITYEYSEGNGNYRIRIWDDNAGAILGSDLTGSDAIDAFVGTGPVNISFPSATYDFHGNMDEMVVFNDILTTGEIDQIRAGTYGAVSAGQVISIL